MKDQKHLKKDKENKDLRIFTTPHKLAKAVVSGGAPRRKKRTEDK